MKASGRARHARRAWAPVLNGCVSPDRDPEVIVAELRSNGAALVVPAVFLILVMAAVGYFGFRLPESWQRWLVLGGGVVLVLLGFVLPLCAWLSRRTTITTRRTILRKGLIAHSRREVLHTRVLEVGLRQTPGQRLAGSGDVLLELGRDRTAVIQNVRSPRLVVDALSDLVEAQREEQDARRSSGELRF